MLLSFASFTANLAILSAPFLVIILKSTTLLLSYAPSPLYSPSLFSLTIIISFLNLKFGIILRFAYKSSSFLNVIIKLLYLGTSKGVVVAPNNIASIFLISSRSSSLIGTPYFLKTLKPPSNS
ncbi:122aa long hypothetical protein [Pyrococcus horikoshii OT3]|uniref:Uncharacterized protein n=1 Tax=Pyrococcus horikoshii (strain ATCC 700860 / DSM 12428 / JCM 9974 / NBRC 100139 / OT-3) TaxID=70601 RepID=O59395_PYRHO|nr:122aa long hypothetical protein [Pyrococcus horikoshii OT3]